MLRLLKSPRILLNILELFRFIDHLLQLIENRLAVSGSTNVCHHSWHLWYSQLYLIDTEALQFLCDFTVIR